MYKLSSLRQVRQAQINSVNVQHEEDCQKLQDELELQKSKVVTLDGSFFFFLKAVTGNYTEKCLVQEAKQRALLHLQWKVMGENQQVDQEVSSKKVRSLFANMVTVYYYFTNQCVHCSIQFCCCLVVRHA